jgi:hypothetical protein
MTRHDHEGMQTASDLSKRLILQQTGVLAATPTRVLLTPMMKILSSLNDASSVDGHNAPWNF